MADDTINPGQFIWPWPSSVRKLRAECYAGGGAGGGSYTTNSTGAGGGGGGGACSVKVFTGLSGDISCSVGSGGTAVIGGAGNNGGQTWFYTNDSSGCLAEGGTGGGAGQAAAGGAAGIGGLIGGGYGDSRYAGGNGYTGQLNGVGGGGGEGAWNGGAGNSATDRIGATGTAGGDGGSGGTAHTPGLPAPSGYSGAGGGAGHRQGTTLQGGVGRVGVILLTYLLVSVSPTPASDDFGGAVTDASGVSVQVLGINVPIASDNQGTLFSDLPDVAIGYPSLVTPINVTGTADNAGQWLLDNASVTKHSLAFRDQIDRIATRVALPSDDLNTLVDAIGGLALTRTFGDNQGASWDDSVQKDVLDAGSGTPGYYPFGESYGSLLADSVGGERSVLLIHDDIATVLSRLITPADDQGANFNDNVDGANKVIIYITNEDFGINAFDGVTGKAARVALISDDQGSLWDDLPTKSLSLLETPTEPNFKDNQGANWNDLPTVTVRRFQFRDEVIVTGIAVGGRYPYDALTADDNIDGILGEYAVTIDEDTLALSDFVVNFPKVLAVPEDDVAYDLDDEVAKQTPNMVLESSVNIPDNEGANLQDGLTDIVVKLPGIMGDALDITDVAGADVYIVLVTIDPVNVPIGDSWISDDGMEGFFKYYLTIDDDQGANEQDTVGVGGGGIVTAGLIKRLRFKWGNPL